MCKIEREELKTIKSERKYDTTLMNISITKGTEELILWKANQLNIEFDEALELMIHISAFTKVNDFVETM